MIDWRRIFGKDDKFFLLLEASALEARNSAVQLGKFVALPTSELQPENLIEFILSRRKDKEITQQITRELCRSFVTPLEREDIESLSNSLYKIPKTVLKVGERMLICPRVLLQDDSLTRQVEILKQAAEIVAQMVGHLRKGGKLELIQDQYSRLQELEGQADKLVTAMLKDLCTGQRDAKDVIILKDVFELLERAIDRCRDAGNTVFQIVLKHS